MAVRKLLSTRYQNDAKAGIVLSQLQQKERDAVNQKLESSEFQTEVFLCECGADEQDFEVLAEKDRYGLKVRTVICKKCGLIMTNPRMTQPSMDQFYDQHYGKLYRNEETPSDKKFKDQYDRGLRIYDFVEHNSFYEYHNVLEIGCSSGGILQVFKENGKDVTGIDLASSYIEYGRTKGLNLIAGHSSMLVSENKKFDLIILNHVFEHFIDIPAELDIIRQLLSPSGQLYIAVPSITAVLSGYGHDFLCMLQSAHIYNFTLTTLTNVMSMQGFELLHGIDTGNATGLFQYNGIKQLRKTCQKNPYKHIYSFLHNWEKLYLQLLLHQKEQQVLRIDLQQVISSIEQMSALIESDKLDISTVDDSLICALLETSYTSSKNSDLLTSLDKLKELYLNTLKTIEGFQAPSLYAALLRMIAAHLKLTLQVPNTNNENFLLQGNQLILTLITSI